MEETKKQERAKTAFEIVDEMKTWVETIDSSDDNNLEILEEAMNNYCSNWDIMDGMKHAIIQTIEDQWGNHSADQPWDDLEALKNTLSKATTTE